MLQVLQLCIIEGGEQFCKLGCWLCCDVCGGEQCYQYVVQQDVIVQLGDCWYLLLMVEIVLGEEWDYLFVDQVYYFGDQLQCGDGGMLLLVVVVFEQVEQDQGVGQG